MTFGVVGYFAMPRMELRWRSGCDAEPMYSNGGFIMGMAMYVHQCSNCQAA